MILHTAGAAAGAGAAAPNPYLHLAGLALLLIGAAIVGAVLARAERRAPDGVDAAAHRTMRARVRARREAWRGRYERDIARTIAASGATDGSGAAS